MKKQQLMMITLGNGSQITVPDDKRVVELVHAMEKSNELKQEDLRNRAEDYKRELLVYKKLYNELLDRVIKLIKEERF